MPIESPVVPQQIGSYDVLSKIAEGGMGAVYKALHRPSGEVVAIKVIPPSTAKNPVLLKRFEQEYRTAASLNHKNIVRAIEFNDDGPNPFLVMEYVDGDSIGAKIDRDGRMPEDEAVRVITQVCQGLYHAHKQKVIHRDVKPDNILLTSDGIAKLTDLGLVKDIDNETNLTKTGRGLGTPNFMAPEQFRNAKNADVRCDIYSLGATLYAMVTGETPFGKVGPLDCWMRKTRNELASPRELNPALSERIDWAIRRAMSADADKRPRNCKEFVEDLTGASLKPPPSSGNTGTQDLWYLVYRDEDGETHTVKGTTDAIRRALKDGLLGDALNIRAGRSKTGNFTGLIGYAEFRDLVVAPAPLPTPGSSSAGQSVRQTPGQRFPTPVSTPTMRCTDPEAVDYAEHIAGPASGQAPTTDYVANSRVSGRPMIPVGRAKPTEPKKESVDWFLWIGVLAVALITAAAAVFLIPRFQF